MDTKDRLLKSRIPGVIVALFFLAGAARGQGDRAAEREAEWRSYKVPSANYVRHIVGTGAPEPRKPDPDSVRDKLLFRVPAEWKEAPGLTFNGPDGSYLRIATETVPDGVPLSQYAISVLQSLQDLAAGPDSIIVRRTQMAGDEGREILLELPDAHGVMQRRTVWMTVQGPTALVFAFVTPTARAAELEPYFKGVIQSANISRGGLGWFLYDSPRRDLIKEDKPDRIDRVLWLAEAVDGPNSQARKEATAALGPVLSESPGALLDLLLDRRPAVRGVAIDAMAASGSRTYDRILLRAVKDLDVLVAERAARVLASRPDVQAMLRDETHDWHENEALFRVWPFLDGKTRKQVVNEIFSRPNFRPSIAGSAQPPQAGGSGSGTKSRQTRPGVRGGRNTGVVTVWADSTPEYNRLFTALSLLLDIPASDQRIPLDEIAASGYDLLIAPALQIGLERRERFRVDALLKLLSSPNEAVSRLAAANLAVSATASDIPRIQEAADRLTSLPDSIHDARPDTKPDAAAEPKKKEQNARLVSDLRATVKKIRLRDRWANAAPGAKSQLIKEGLADTETADWTWEEYERAQSEAAEGGGGRQGSGSAARENAHGDGVATKSEHPSAGTGGPAREASVSGLGENIFPWRVSLYAAMRNPSATFKKLGDSLTGLQMDMAPDQALFVLMLSSIKERLARTLGAGPDQSLAANIGIDLNAPIAAARWTSEGAPLGLKAAQRKAVIMRVSDRERLERLLGLFQMHVGGFSNFTEGFSLVSRFIGLLPAVLPSAAGIAKSGPAPEKHSPGYKFEFRRTDQIRGHKVTVIERRQASPDGEVESDAIYLTYIGDEAVIAPDGFSLSEALANLESGKSSLSDNAEFKRAAGRGGDVIYLSDLTTLFGSGTSSGGSSKEAVQIGESGALDISNTAWANSYRLSIPDSTWLKPLMSFQPQTHAAASELLPSSTVMYLLIKLDVASVWRGLRLAMFSDRGAIRDISSAWSLDFEKEVLPELGPECGAALLGVPNLDGKFGAPWVIFFKLKTGRLAEAMKQGRLIKNSRASEIQHLKIGTTDVAVEIRNGFLVLGANEAALRRLVGPERLASARDFARAASKAPNEVIAFGGYNLEAASAELKGDSGDYRSEAVIRVLKSLVRAFHSQNFYITADGLALDAHMSVSLDREGRYSVAELAAMSKDYKPTYVTVEARGARISDQQRLASLKLKIRVKPAGVIDRIVEDLKTENQSVASTTEQELIVNVKPRRTEPTAQIKLPVTDKQFTPWLGATGQIRSDDKDVIARAREIAGGDSDAWSVARKLGDWIYKNMKWRVVEPGDAAHTLATREAACLEFSELYVAMARVLGLPARIVTGLAYSDGSFGGHAWVEVYAGRWIEIDPTWGTSFVDATHLRETTDDLTTYAALNLASIEVIEAPRVVSDFQRDPALLVGKLCEELPKGIESALTVGVDLALVTDQMMGSGAWSGLGDGERDQMSSAFHRLILSLSRAYRAGEDSAAAMRVLKVTTTGDQADALVMAPALFVEAPLRLRLKRTGDIWIVTDIVDIDTDFHILTENLRPAAERIEAKRNGGHAEMNPLSTRGRIDVLLNQDPKAAMELVDRELEKEPRSAPLRHLKALSLERLSRTDEAVNLWTQLSEEKPPFAPALLELAGQELAGHYESGDKKEPKKAIDLYERYGAAVPDDPRPYESLGDLYEREGDMVHAEAEFRACIERDPDNLGRYDDLARVLALQHHYAEAVAALNQGSKHGGKDLDMFANLLAELDDPKQADIAEALAAAQPERMAASARANLNLAYIRVAADRPRDALPLLKKAIELDPKSGDAYDEMAVAHRKLQEWRAALTAADAAVKISDEDSDAHYNRACALARLGRLSEALVVLKRSIDLDVEEQLDFANEEDLKPLARMAGFKKLLSDRQEKQEKDK